MQTHHADRPEVSGDAQISKTLDGTIIGWSAGAEKLFGYKAEEMIGQSILRLFPPDRCQEEDAILTRLKAGERIEEYRTLRLTKDGYSINVSLTILPVKNQAGHIVGALKVMRDISDPKLTDGGDACIIANRQVREEGLRDEITSLTQAKQALQESEERYALVIEGANAAIWDWNVPEKRVFFSPRWKALRGLADDEVSDRESEWSSRIHPDDRERVMTAVGAHFEGRTAVFSEEYRVRHKDESWIWILDHGIAKRDSAGNVLRMAGSETDITERKRAEEALRRSEHRYRTLVDVTSAVTWTCPPTGLHVEPQPSWMAFTGQTAEEMLGAGWTKVVHPDDLAKAAERWSDAVVKGEPFTNEHRIRRYDGEWRWMSVTAAPIHDADGQVLEWSGMNIDITERKQAEEALQERNRQLELLALASQRLLLGGETEQELLETIFGDIAQLIDMDMFYHYRPDETPRMLRLHTSGGITEKEQSLFATMRFGELLCGRVAEWQTRIIIEDLQHSTHPGSDVLRAAGATSYAGFPLVAKGELVGTIAFTSNRRTHLREGDVLMIQTICDQIATALERTRLQRELRESEARFRTMAEAVPSFLFETNAAGLNTWTSDEWCRFTGQTSDQVAGHGWADALHPEDRAANIDRWVECMKDGVTFESQQRLRRTDGTYAWVIARALPVRDEEGRVTRWVGSVTDVDEIVCAQDALLESKEHLSHELEATRSLQAVSTALFDSDDEAAIYERILDAAMLIMRSQYASIQLWDESRDELKLLGYRGFSHDAAAFWEWVRPASSSTCGVALRTRERVLVTDVTQCEWMTDTEDLATYLGTGILAVQTTPLLTRDSHLLGMLSTHWDKPHQPSPEEVQRLDILARMAADMLARQQSDAALRESEQRLRLACQAGQVGLSTQFRNVRFLPT